MGDFVNVFFEADNPAGVMQSIKAGATKFDTWFAGKIQEIHGIDVKLPTPGPVSEVVFKYNP